MPEKDTIQGSLPQRGEPPLCASASPPVMTEAAFRSAVERVAQAHAPSGLPGADISVTVAAESLGYVHTRQVDPASLAKVLVDLSQALPALVTTVSVSGPCAYVVSVAATPAEIELAIGARGVEETFRIQSTAITTFVWLAMPDTPNANGAQATASSPDGWELRKFFADAALVSLPKCDPRVALPVAAPQITSSSGAFDPVLWSPALPRGVERILAEADVPALGSLPFTWPAIEWINHAFTKGRVETRVHAVLRVVIATMQVLAHIDSGGARPMFNKMQRKWHELLAVVKRYLGCVEVDVLRLGKPGPVRLAFDPRSHAIVAVQAHYAIDRWPSAENHKVFEALVSKNITPTLGMQEVEGRNGPTFQLAFAQPPKVSKVRLAGDPGARCVLGIPDVDYEYYPIAFKESGATAERQAGPSTITLTRVPTPPEFESPTPMQAQALRDPIGLLLRLFREMKTPFRTADDVRRFAMMLAAPLLRGVAVGRLPAFLLIGGSGSGKGLTKYVLFLIWSLSGTRAAPRDCFVGIEGVDGHEQNLQFANAAPRIFISFIEAAKAGTLELIVRLCERETVSGRGHYGNPIEVPNAFVYVADAVEGFSSKLETARRSVKIGMRAVSSLDREAGEGSERAFVPTTFISELAEIGPHLIEGLRRLIVARGVEFVASSSDDSGRAAATNALAAVCGVSLDEVRGSPLTELFNMIVDLVVGTPYTDGRGQRAVAKAEPQTTSPTKASRLARKFAGYSPSAILKLAALVPEHAELQRNLKHGSTIMRQIEVEYGRMFVNLHAGKCPVLVVYARESWWVYAPGNDVFSLAPFDQVRQWAGSTLGAGAESALVAAQAKAKAYFEVADERVRALEALLDAIAPIVQYGMQSTNMAGAFAAVEALYPQLRQRSLTPDEKRLVVVRVLELAVDGWLHAECELWSDANAENAVRAGLTSTATPTVEATATQLRDEPSWAAFCGFRLLVPLAVTAHRELVAELGVMAGVLSESAWMGPTSVEPIDDELASASLSTLEQWLVLHETEEFDDASLEEIAIWSDSSSWSQAA